MSFKCFRCKSKSFVDEDGVTKCGKCGLTIGRLAPESVIPVEKKKKKHHHRVHKDVT